MPLGRSPAGLSGQVFRMDARPNTAPTGFSRPARGQGAGGGRPRETGVAMPDKSQLKIGSTKLEVSNLDKVLYPKAGFTKGQVIDYYIKVSPALLPHLRDRPITLKRYPDGVEGFFSFTKKMPRSQSGVDQKGNGPQDRRRRNQLLPAQQPACAGLGGEPGGFGVAHLPASRAKNRATHGAGVRPRSGRAGGHCSLLPGWPLAQSHFGKVRLEVFPENVWFKGAANLRALEHAGDL